MSMPYAFTPEPETFDPWSDCDWADFRDGTEVVSENCHRILGWRLGMTDDEIERYEADLVDVWEDLTETGRSRYVDAFKRVNPEKVREMFNKWYWQSGRARYSPDGE